jgi:guanylate kinase
MDTLLDTDGWLLSKSQTTRKARQLEVFGQLYIISRLRNTSSRIRIRNVISS